MKKFLRRIFGGKGKEADPSSHTIIEETGGQNTVFKIITTPDGRTYRYPQPRGGKEVSDIPEGETQITIEPNDD